jgi:hypothetical protein
MTFFANAKKVRHPFPMNTVKVRARNCDGELVELWAVDANERVVYLTSDRGLREIETTGDTLLVVGFPIDDVFLQTGPGETELAPFRAEYRV